MTIVVQREKKHGDLVTGTLTVNSQTLGRMYENAKLMVATGRYQGYLRYVSGHSFVRGPFGSIAHSGDFLVEVGDVRGRTDILFHGGNKPHHSRGCVLLGPVGEDPKTHTPHLGYDHPLRKLRRLFYGTENPVMAPAKDVAVHVERHQRLLPVTHRRDGEGQFGLVGDRFEEGIYRQARRVPWYPEATRPELAPSVAQVRAGCNQNTISWPSG